MGGRLQLQVPTLRSESTRTWEREVIHIFTGSNTPRPRTPTPCYRHLLWRGRGRLTTHGIHLNLSLGLSYQPGPPPVAHRRPARVPYTTSLQPFLVPKKGGPLKFHIRCGDTSMPICRSDLVGLHQPSS